jgi:hypothetical protein
MQSSTHSRNQETSSALEAGPSGPAPDAALRLRSTGCILESSSLKSFFSASWPFLLFASFALLIFWHLPGGTCYEGDDYLQTKIYPLFKLPTNLDSYMTFIRGRAFLPWAYKVIYLAVGRNFNTAVYAFVAVYLAVAAGFYLTLRRFLSIPAALAGSLILLCHCAKYHAILAYNAQIYSIVIACAILILNVMISKLPRLAQSLIATLLIWVSIHFYEILMVLVPIFPAVWLGPSLIKRRFPSFSNIVASLLPILAAGTHICLLSFAQHPLWARNGDQPSRLLELPQGILNLFLCGSSTIFGAVHWDTLKRCTGNFFKFDVRADHSLWFPLALAMLTTIGTVWLVYRNKLVPPTTENRKLIVCMFSIGLYLLLLGPLIGLPVSTTEVASRLLYLPVLGLALAVAAAIDLIGNARVYRCAVSLLLVCCLAEAITFADVVQQYIDAAKLDQSLTQQILSLERLKPGAHLFMSLPFNNKKIDYWRQGLPAYYCCGTPIRLWEAASLGLDKITYYAVMREPTNLHSNGLYPWLKDALKKYPEGDLYPFYLDDKQKLHVLTKVELVSKYSEPERTVRTGFNGTKYGSAAMVMKIDQDLRYFPPF